MDFEHVQIPKHEDKRGFLIEFLSARDLHDRDKMFAQIYCATLLPGSARGNHFHKKKNEWITVISGKVRLSVEDTVSHKRRELIIDASSGGSLARVRVGRNVAHLIENIGNNSAVIVAYTTKVYDSADLDQYYYQVKR